MAVEKIASTASTEQSPIQFGQQIEAGADTHAHDINQDGFLSLSTPESLHTLVEHGKVLELSIAPEIEQLTHLQSQGHDGYLSVTLPMVGLTDYLSSEGSDSASHAFGSVLGLNHFSADSQQSHFSRPDFIMAKDIVGNQYEILVEPNGKVAAPEDGVGKFSLLSEVKLMYGLDQVLEGRGLSEGGASAQPGSLYLMPPPGFHGKYSPVISVSQTQDDFSEKELSSRKAPVLLQEAHNETGPYKAVIDAHNLGLENQQEKLSDLGWQPSNQAGSFEKHFGLSDVGLHSVSKYLFTEYDFTKSILSGDEFGVKHTNGLNDFGMSPEAIGVYYDLWLSSMVNHQISPDNFLARITPQDLLGIQNFEELGLSPADQLSMEAILTQAKLGDFSGLQNLYEPHFNQPDSIQQHVLAELGLDHTHAQGVSVEPVNADLPAQHADLIEHNTIQDHLSDIHVSSQDNQGAFGKTVALNFDDVFAPGEHPGAIISGFNVNQDKLDLSHLLNQMPSLQIQDLSADLHGQDVHINYQDPNTGQVQTLATLVSAAPDHFLPDLLHYLSLHHE